MNELRYSLAQCLEHPKIEAARIEWREFRGLTVLLHNPSEVVLRDGLAHHWCDLDRGPGLSLYRALACACDELRLGDHFFRHGLALLPRETFHTTFCDLIHPLNISELSSNVRHGFQTILDNLPYSLLDDLPDCLPPHLFAQSEDLKIRFRFRDLIFPNCDPLLARLEPADSESVESLQRLLVVRNRIDKAFVELGKRPNSDWTPHISLGYAAIPALAKELKSKLPEWQDVIRSHTKDLVVEYSSFKLTGFRSMIDFWQRPDPQRRLKGGLVVVTTPRINDPTGIQGFLNYVRNWRRMEPRICGICLVMPSRTKPQVRDQILRMLDPSTSETLHEMAPAASGCGAIYQAAAEFAFNSAPQAEAIAHLPIDCDWDSQHEDDVLLRVSELIRILDWGQPGLLLGDYTPRIWGDGRSQRHLSKEWCGRAVDDQMTHYNFRPGIKLCQWRTEFFAISRAAFSHAADSFSVWDPTPFVAMKIKASGEFIVDRVDLGVFYEAGAEIKMQRVYNQIWRFAEQAAHAYMQQQIAQGANPNACKLVIDEGFAKAFNAMQLASIEIAR